jgi:hypothetical protein
MLSSFVGIMLGSFSFGRRLQVFWRAVYTCFAETTTDYKDDSDDDCKEQP